MDLIKEIKSDLLKQDVNLSTILRKAKVLSSTLRNKKLKEWVNNELNGYSAKDSSVIPNYRNLSLENFGYFSGFGGAGIKNARIPIILLPDKAKEFAKDTKILESIRSLESLASSNRDGTIQIKWSADLIVYTNQKKTIYSGMSLVDAWKMVSPSQIEGILDQVKNKLLDFIIELEEQYPDLVNNEDTLKQIPSKIITNYVNNYIYGSDNIVASGTNVNQTQNIKIKNNIDYLKKELSELNIPLSDINNLEDAIKQDGDIKGKNLGAKVSAWIGTITTEVLTGTVDLAKNTSVAIIAELILRYYGL